VRLLLLNGRELFSKRGDAIADLATVELDRRLARPFPSRLLA